jgi:microcystin degradation protein MlrC
MPPRVAVLGLWHETNTYAPHPTTLDDFARFELAEGDEIAAANAGTGSVIGGFLDRDDLDLRLCFSAGAWPGGTIVSEARARIADRTLAAMERAGRVDGVLVNLHGAMVAEDDPDPELAMLKSIRERWPDAPVAGVLDLHANPSPAVASHCDALISYDTYPHVDMRERGQEAAALLAGMLRRQARLRTAIVKVPILATPLAQATDEEPMRGLQRRAAERGIAAGLARVCVVGGFAYSDVGRAGVSVLAVHDDEHAPAARDVVEATARDIEEHAADFAVRRDGVAIAVRRALASGRTPVILVDVADNVGGGTPGDGTELLRELLAQHATRALVIMADAEVARAAHAVGPGGTFAGALGGKAGDLHGRPLEVTATVERAGDGRYRAGGSWMTGREFEMGATAVLAVEGVTVVVTERRVPPFHVEQVTSLGIDPAAMRVVVVKAAHAWRAAYGAIAGEIIEVDTPGACPVDPGVLDRRHAPVRFP